MAPGSESVPHRRRRWWRRWRRRPDDVQEPDGSDEPSDSSDAERPERRPLSDPLPEIPWTNDPDFSETEWAEVCHRLDGRRSRHEPGLEPVETLFERPTTERHLYQCRHCGLIYLRQWHEMNDWGSFGDRTEEIVLWYPISEREAEAARRDINYEPSPRNHLEFRDRY